METNSEPERTHLKIMVRNKPRSSYLEILNQVVSDTLVFGVTNHVISSELSRDDMGRFVIEWTYNGKPLLVDNTTRDSIVSNIRSVPDNVCLVKNELSQSSDDKAISKHDKLNIWWSINACSRTAPVSKMDGVYLTIPEESIELIAKLDRMIKLKRCTCINRHPGLIYYHVDSNTSILDLMAHLDLFKLIGSALLNQAKKTSPVDFTVLELLLQGNLEVFDDLDWSVMSYYRTETLKGSIWVRVMLSKEKIASFILQDFDKTYLVMYYDKELKEPKLGSTPKCVDRVDDTGEIREKTKKYQGSTLNLASLGWSSSGDGELLGLMD